jgi:hypothetical protein
MPEMYFLLRIAAKVLLFIVIVFFALLLLTKGWRKTKITFIIIYLLCIIIPTVKAAFNPDSVITTSQSIENLQSLPYLQWASAEGSLDKMLVTKHDPNLAFPGLNLYTPSGEFDAYLFNMNGKILHKWQLEEKHERPCAYVELLDNGDLLAFSEDERISRIGWDSNVIWTQPIPAHHDFYETEDGQIYSLGRENSIVFFFGLPVPIVEENIYIMTAQGRVTKKITYSNCKAIKKHVPAKALIEIYLSFLNPKNIKKITQRKRHGYYPLWTDGRLYDILHPNSIELMDRDIEGVCKKGDILLSIRNINLIGILDSKTHEFIWTWGPGIVEQQHHPTLLENGNILLFDNGSYRGYSKIIELEPKTKKIVWQYTAEPKGDFFSKIRGANQRLPNGNTLITESDRGRIFEVTEDGKIVWEFYCPDIKLDTKERRAIYRAIRIIEPHKYPMLKKLLTESP